MFSSIRADEIDLGRAGGAGVVALKTFLKFAETGLLGSATGETDRRGASPLEESIQRALEGEGYEVLSHVGSSGFYVDLAIVDPERPGSYLLGIECDGPGYHSARSARERDRQRQGVLEQHGWTTLRIWSVDWFNRPRDELSKLLKEIGKAAAHRDLRGATLRATEPIRVPQVVAREEDSGPVFSSVPYRKARVQPILPYELSEVPIDSLMEVALRVVEAESPVHRKVVAIRLREAWGLQKTGSRIVGAVDRALTVLQRLGKVEEEEDFFRIPGAPVPVRDRSEFTGDALRALEHLPPAEIREAMIRVIADSCGIAPSDLPAGVARLLGFSATSPQLAAKVEALVIECLDRGAIEERQELLVLGGGSVG